MAEFVQEGLEKRFGVEEVGWVVRVDPDHALNREIIGFGDDVAVCSTACTRRRPLEIEDALFAAVHGDRKLTEEEQLVEDYGWRAQNDVGIVFPEVWGYLPGLCVGIEEPVFPSPDCVVLGKGEETWSAGCIGGFFVLELRVVAVPNISVKGCDGQFGKQETLMLEEA